MTQMKRLLFILLHTVLLKLSCFRRIMYVQSDYNVTRIPVVTRDYQKFHTIYAYERLKLIYFGNKRK